MVKGLTSKFAHPLRMKLGMLSGPVADLPLISLVALRTSASVIFLL